MTFVVKDRPGILAVWGTAGKNMNHIRALEARAVRGYPIEIQCEWNTADEPQRERFGHEWWVEEDDFLQITS
jgi:hypothetical protein